MGTARLDMEVLADMVPDMVPGCLDTDPAMDQVMVQDMGLGSEEVTARGTDSGL